MSSSPTPTMYPDWPESPADLIPLPQCPGPKLEPFDFGGPQNIEFLSSLGDGLHSYVFKVKINDELYALKLFRFVTDHWAPIYNAAYRPDDQEALAAFAGYSEPFNCESRAFGRLREAGHEDLAVKCFGYVLLTEANERALKVKYPGISFNGDRGNQKTEEETRGRFRGKSGRPPPIRGILKKLGTQRMNLHDREFRSMRRIVMALHQLGIMRLDVAARQFIDGKMADFSIAVTTPHYLTSPELNGELTERWVTALERETFLVASADFREFDRMVHLWNKHDLLTGEVAIEVRGFAKHGYALRSSARRAAPYTYVDPRRYDWKKRGVVKARKTRARIVRIPAAWYYGGEDDEVGGLWKQPQYNHHIGWTVRGGLLFPTSWGCHSDCF